MSDAVERELLGLGSAANLETPLALEPEVSPDGEFIGTPAAHWGTLPVLRQPRHRLWKAATIREVRA